MGLPELVNLFSKYGIAGVIIAVLLFALGALYLQNTKNYKERIDEANKRADRFEAEVKTLNGAIEKYLLLGMSARNVMGEAADEMRRLQ